MGFSNPAFEFGPESRRRLQLSGLGTIWKAQTDFGLLDSPLILERRRRVLPLATAMPWKAEVKLFFRQMQPVLSARSKALIRYGTLDGLAVFEGLVQRGFHEFDGFLWKQTFANTL